MTLNHLDSALPFSTGLTVSILLAITSIGLVAACSGPNSQDASHDAVTDSLTPHVSPDPGSHRTADPAPTTTSTASHRASDEGTPTGPRPSGVILLLEPDSPVTVPTAPVHGDAMVTALGPLADPLALAEAACGLTVDSMEPRAGGVLLLPRAPVEDDAVSCLAQALADEPGIESAELEVRQDYAAQG